MLSLWEGYHRSSKPLPWQLLCHPANLQILPTLENIKKGKHSILNPKQLRDKIVIFEKEHGKVALPIERRKSPKPKQI